VIILKKYFKVIADRSISLAGVYYDVYRINTSNISISSRPDNFIWYVKTENNQTYLIFVILKYLEGRLKGKTVSKKVNYALSENSGKKSNRYYNDIMKLDKIEFNDLKEMKTDIFLETL
jgi:hypothetical protein